MNTIQLYLNGCRKDGNAFKLDNQSEVHSHSFSSCQYQRRTRLSPANISYRFLNSHINILLQGEISLLISIWNMQRWINSPMAINCTMITGYYSNDYEQNYIDHQWVVFVNNKYHAKSFAIKVEHTSQSTTFFWWNNVDEHWTATVMSETLVYASHIEEWTKFTFPLDHRIT